MSLTTEGKIGDERKDVLCELFKRSLYGEELELRNKDQPIDYIWPACTARDICNDEYEYRLKPKSEVEVLKEKLERIASIANFGHGANAAIEMIKELCK